jgi:hypothetical protein
MKKDIHLLGNLRKNFSALKALLSRVTDRFQGRCRASRQVTNVKNVLLLVADSNFITNLLQRFPNHNLQIKELLQNEMIARNKKIKGASNK